MTDGFAFHPEAVHDLTEIWDYIAADSIAAADRVVNEILAQIEAVVPFPQAGHYRPDLTGRPLRFVRYKDYLIAYAPYETPLWVLAILHGTRNPKTLAALLQGRR